MRLVVIIFMAFVLAAFGPASDKASENAVSSVLDQFHAAAAEADWDTYFRLMRDDAIFLGTDVKERWDKETFQAYAAKAPNGWLYRVLERNLDFTADGNTAWFDEVLVNAKYGTSRGTGVMIRNKNGRWLIAQYHLTFPIPNELAGEMTKKIQEFTAVAK